MAEKDLGRRHPLVELTAITSADGRYRRNTEVLVPYVSEYALIRNRFDVEARYMIALSEAGIVRPLVPHEKDTLTGFGPNLTLEQAQRIKEIEDTTDHDVKAVEFGFREFLSSTSLEDVLDMLHFAITSEDVNNLSYRQMFDQATREVLLPVLDETVDALALRADKYKNVIMLARTHGQAAVPTTLGKEFANIAARLNKQVRKLDEARLTGKLTGAVGNFNAHVFAAPEVDWIEFSRKFVESFGFEPNLITTQINPYEDMIEMFQIYQRINGIFIDMDEDIWRYISDYWLAQEVRRGEVGSSTMPQKVNPIRFERSEGNAEKSNFFFEGMSRTLAVSRLQRDLSDSTVIRDMGVPLAFGLLSYQNALEGLGRVRANEALIGEQLNADWMILTEGVQIALRREGGVEDPYSMVATLARGEKIGPEGWRQWVSSLPIREGLKAKFLRMTPQEYIGEAQRLTEMAIEEIKNSRKSKVN